MKALLDTHVWLWLQTTPERLSGEALALVEDTSNDLFLSAASAWEIAIKYALGKLPLPEPPDRYVASRLAVSGTSELPVKIWHAVRVSALPPHHRDPIDRLLIAQAQLEDLVLVTVDGQFAAYGVEMISAG